VLPLSCCASVATSKFVANPSLPASVGILATVLNRVAHP
jgi:hypothetical protein